MRAIRVEGQGKDVKLVLGEIPAPSVGEGQIGIRVAATAVNRADLLQARGMYPAPPGASEILGLECSGTVDEVGEGVEGFAVGDRVMALLSGGGYAERAVVHAGSVMPIPERISLIDAAGIPEVFLTCDLNLFQLAGVPRGGAALVHGGGSGIGTCSIQLLKHAGVTSIVTAGSDDKCKRCIDLGADHALNYREAEFAPRVLELTGGRGVDVVFDSIGAPYLAQHLKCLAIGGRLVLIGLMGGAKAEVNLGPILVRRLSVIGSTLRARPDAEKAQIVSRFWQRAGEALVSGEIGPEIDRVLQLAEAQRAHEVVSASEHFGKVVLAVRDD
ncbi:MAG: NAD(P)H-quinone oxidoreductase [bacterium]|nr:NAD(P)H-quinone oxidoreductase [bacterium]